MNILIVGLGKIARTHIGALRTIDPLSNIYALRSSATPASSMPGVTDVFMLDDVPSCDFAIISNITAAHASAIERLLELNIPLFIEKPIFESTRHSHIIDKIRQRGIPTYVACCLRFLDVLIYIRNFLESHPDKPVNEVNVYCGIYLPKYHQGSDYRSSYNALPELGGGINIDMIHDLDYICWIFGIPEKVTSFFSHKSSIGIKACDYANYLLEYPSFNANIILNYYRPQPKRTLEIVFDDEIWLADMRANTITDAQGAIIYKGVNTVADTYVAQLRYFINAISKGEPIENDAENAFRILSLAL